MISHTMNKLIKRFFLSPVHASFFFSTLELILTESKSKRGRERGKGREGGRKKERERELE